MAIPAWAPAKAWDIHKTVKSTKRLVERAVDKAEDPIKDNWAKLKKAVK